MKRILLTIIAVTTLIACDNTFEELDAKNNPPTVRIIHNGTEQEAMDTKLKTSLKHGLDHYTIELIVFDAELGFTSLAPQLVVGTGYFKQNGAEVSVFTVVDNRATVEFYPTGGISEAQIRFVGTDNLGSTGFAQLNLEIFDNKPPVAVFRGIELVGVNGAREYYLHHDSYDLDVEQGGGLYKLEWTVNGLPINKYNLTETTLVVFETAGNYQIRLRVQDNDGAYSDWVTQPTFTIN